MRQLKKEAQKLVNKYVRLRDSDGYGFTCISCREYFPISQMNAGHFIHASRCDAVRFDTRNIHGQCVFKCNNIKEGNHEAYECNLIAKIGQSEYDDLMATVAYYKQNLHFWGRDELEEIINKHKQLIKELENSEDMPF